MFDRQKFGKYLYTTVHKFLDGDELPKVHDDVELKPGETFGLVIGSRRYVFSLDEGGELSIKTQKQVTRWEDVDSEN
jgi:hypothetical protein